MDAVIPGPGLAGSVQPPLAQAEWAARPDEALAFFERARPGAAGEGAATGRAALAERAGG